MGEVSASEDANGLASDLMRGEWGQWGSGVGAVLAVVTCLGHLGAVDFSLPAKLGGRKNAAGKRPRPT